MPRSLREKYPGSTYHLIARGNAKAPIVYDDEDRKAFLCLLGQVVTTHQWKCYAYCLMDNHYHLLLETPNDTLSQGMHRLNGVYAQRFNGRHHRTGHLFQDRFKSLLVEKDAYFFQLVQYILQNPVRAGMVPDARTFVWGSYPEMIGKAKRAILDPDFINAARRFGW